MGPFLAGLILGGLSGAVAHLGFHQDSGTSWTIAIVVFLVVWIGTVIIIEGDGDFNFFD